MGDNDSPNHEWIELHNDSAAVDVTGWTLTDGAHLTIELSGTIPSESYVVLERTSDESAPGGAFLMYTGALVNTGATLQLIRADGGLEDQIIGGEDWQNIGGDNTTKETAQYTSGGWVTAVATPGRAAALTKTVSTVVDDPEPSLSTSGGGRLAKPISTQPLILTLPDVTLELSISAPSVGYVHQPIEFTVTPTGVGNSLIASLQYEWNFGDGTVDAVKEPTHVYDYPGTYVVTVYAGYKRQEQVARQEITILPVSLSLTTNREGDVQLNNDSSYEVDLSGYRLVADREFTFPPRTILLPQQTITIAHQRLGQTDARLVAVYDTEAVLVASHLPEALQTVRSSEVLAANDLESFSNHMTPVTPSVVSPVSEVMEEPTEVTPKGVMVESEASRSVGTDTLQIASAGAAPRSDSSRWPYVGLASVLLLGTLGVYAAPRRNESE